MLSRIQPLYLRISEAEFRKKINQLFAILQSCQVCPRKCQVNRLKGEKGFCQLGYLPVVASYHPHFGEEKVLVGTRGSGAIFFSCCNLACLYCQNYEISQFRKGREISFERLAEMMIELQNLGCHNINLVTPTPQVPQIVKALFLARKKGLRLPIVYNTGGYDSKEILKILDGLIDIYMPDLKYSDDKIALKYSRVPDYFERAKEAVKEMHRQVGDLKLEVEDKKIKISERGIEGIALRGLLVRHLVLPNNLAGSKKIFEFLAKEISPNTFINIMDQYYPHYQAHRLPEINRPITAEEFNFALELAKKAGLKRIYH